MSLSLDSHVDADHERLLRRNFPNADRCVPEKILHRIFYLRTKLLICYFVKVETMRCNLSIDLMMFQT